MLGIEIMMMSIILFLVMIPMEGIVEGKKKIDCCEDIWGGLWGVGRDV
jgi:hypothetical protein